MEFTIYYLFIIIKRNINWHRTKYEVFSKIIEKQTRPCIKKDQPETILHQYRCPLQKIVEKLRRRSLSLRDTQLNQTSGTPQLIENHESPWCIYYIVSDSTSNHCLIQMGGARVILANLTELLSCHGRQSAVVCCPFTFTRRRLCIKLN